MNRVHVIGAGLAGLSAAVQLADAGADVIIHEQAKEAGGRARSFHDTRLDAMIDNGNHLLLSGNHAVMAYLSRIHALELLEGPREAKFDFFDLETGDDWTINFNRGPVPLWVLYKDRRVPGTSMRDYLSGLKLLTAGNRTIAELFGGQGQMYRRFWEPFSVAVLNTLPHEAVGRLLMPVIRETLAKGADYSRPMVAKKSLSHSLVEPALAWLARHRGDVRFGQRISKIRTDGKRVTAISTARSTSEIGTGDHVVLAVPAQIAPGLVDGLSAPDEFAPIVNVHFRPRGFDGCKVARSMLGLVGSPAHWLFVRGDIISVTVSAAFDLAAKPADEIAGLIWPDVARAYGLDGNDMPPVRIIKEHRATFRATARQLARRSKAVTRYNNLFIAGDWTDT
ncbi:MAG TPA: FAD-binding protein, partial [Rhizobiales bacterium]|nr:FAD-binding protein [Hyphomicrobiales bacterium]